MQEIDFRQGFETLFQALDTDSDTLRKEVKQIAERSPEEIIAFIRRRTSKIKNEALRKKAKSLLETMIANTEMR